ncbi:hypothetical protein SERLA73DRAFT_110780 [Serpula lacrymans var. lacrymans S7.3]|uniref:Uncharacterized protein n=1 Tax=Serpula lacrymans var. lacrymans (strain S7.3) TaxID=936435 RepID=F8Q2V9_SERL3|nr:hypothetical protein SERLA73DRAFT_110780 [Serpula lacrymans var. lacrymans S7.3]
MKYASRKYVDLIRQTSAKWANWDPPIPVQPGDYGTIDKETGEFLKEGNIYDPDFAPHLATKFPNLDLSKHKPVTAEEESDFIVSSTGVRRTDFKFGPDIGIAGIASASLKGEWQFQEGRRGALLVMHAPRQTYIPPGTILEPLYNIPLLKDKYLVTSVFSCPAYSLYLSNKSSEKVALALVGSVPLPSAPAVSAGGEISLEWWTNTQTSFLRKASHKTGSYCYTPLFKLQRKLPLTRRLFRDSPVPPPEGDDFWTDVHQPWEPLDEDGDEDPVYDEDVDFDQDPTMINATNQQSGGGGADDDF